jgi:hypothetical protein
MIRTLTLSAFCLATTAQAQVTLDYGLLDQDGMQLTMYLVTDPGSSTVPSDGTNQTWDLSTVTLQPIGTLDFISATGTPFAANYPGANWVWLQTVTGVGSEYMYLDIDQNGIAVHATGVPLNTNDYIDPKLVMLFPMNYGQSFTDNYTDEDGPASVTWSYTGHGTVVTPLGSYSNTVKLVSTEDDLLLWNTSPLHPLVIDDGTDVLAFGPSTTGMADLAGITAKVYPNPCDNLLFVDVSGAAPWRIVDLQGRTLRTGSFNGMGTQVIDIADLATGSYLLVLDEARAQRSVRFSRS